MNTLGTPLPSAARTLGRYEIIGALASGGMATVYLARHTGEAGFQRLYAIKVLHPHLAEDAVFIDMLLDEARIAARLHHPNVVPIVDLGSQDGLHYVVMEYVEGCTLGSLLSNYRDSRPPELIIPLVLDALSGLQAAHVLTDDDGVPMHLVHRDVSPQNLLVGIDGTARITDFGIAKAESRIQSTRPGTLKGKLAFTSPEQIMDSARVDARSDIFAAGAMLWSALTGRRLFLGATDAETIHHVLTLEIPPASTVGHKPPAALDPVIARALDRDPNKRFATAADFEDALLAAAISVDALGTKRAVANWVTSGFAKELEDRRAAIRLAIQSKREPHTQVSGLRMIPQIASITPSGMNNKLAAPSGPTPPAVQERTLPQDAAAPGKRALSMIVIGAALLGFAALAGIAIAVGGRHRGAATADRPSDPATTSAPSSTVAPAGAAAAVATTIGAASDGPATNAASSSASASSAAGMPAGNTAPRAADRPRTSWVPVHAAPPAVKPPTPTPTQATATDKPDKKKAWDNDSPLPPQ